ncbi:MAG TPA: ATP-binding cassette domain-containing protein [Firmicutes bacterium]|nr:ATP-binding cassette domain-containing protein [Bacillota bacterium]
MLLLNRTLIKMAKGLWGWIVGIAALKMVTLMGTAAFARIISGFLGNVDSPSLSWQQARSAIFSAFVAALAMLLAELLTGEAEYRCTAKARQSLRTQIFSKVLELDVGNVEKIGPVSAITSSVDGVEAMQIYYSKYLPGLLYCLCAPIYLFFQMRTASLPVAAMLFVISMGLMPLNNVFRKHIEKLKTEYWSSMEDLTGYYLESVQGLTTLKLYGQDERRTAVLKEKSFAFNRKIMEVMRVNFSSFLLTDGLIYGSVVAATAIVGSQLALGRVTFSAALMVLLLSFGFFGSVRQLMNATHSALAGVSAAEKVSTLLQIDTTRPYDPKAPREPNAFDGIRLENVSYSYEGRKSALRNVSLTVPRGKITALVGLSGCGKSTVAGLLMRFFDPATGKITMEGQDYISFTPEELRRRIIMVPQSVSLFSGTLAENLRIAAPQATDEELWEALEQVRLKDWALAQPAGLETDVGDGGGKLSGGQRQKIGIARALLCQAEYIIFDEATSSVDIESEQEIWSCMDELAATRTLIIISHRLSTIRGADVIYVLAGGQIAQQGDHHQLMERQGLYRQLVEEQAALEKMGEEGLRYA